MSKIVSIILIREFARPSKGVHVRRRIIRRTKIDRTQFTADGKAQIVRKIVSIVDDFFTPSSPAKTFVFSITGTVHQRFHAIVVETGWLEEY